MYHVSAQGLDERMINIHCYYYPKNVRCMMHAEKTAILYSFQIHAICNLDCVRLFHRLAVTADCLIAMNSGHHS